MNNGTVSLLGAFIQEGLSLMGLPGGSMAGEVLSRVMRSREEQARLVLQEVLAAGRIEISDAISEDAAAAILFRYLRSAQEGAARRNLRLMAQVIRGQVLGGALVADRFLLFADMISSLRREEIVLVGAFSKLWAASDGVAMSYAERVVQTWKMMSGELVGKALFPDQDTLRGIAWGLTRTGLVLITDAMWDEGRIAPSPLLVEIAAMCDFEAAAEET